MNNRQHRVVLFSLHYPVVWLNVFPLLPVILSNPRAICSVCREAGTSMLVGCVHGELFFNNQRAVLDISRFPSLFMEVLSHLFGFSYASKGFLLIFLFLGVLCFYIVILSVFLLDSECFYLSIYSFSFFPVLCI